MTIVPGSLARHVPGFVPDLACISSQSLSSETDERVNRVPGEVSFTWDISLLNGSLEDPFTLSTIAKVYTYANQHNTSYGYLLTNNALLVLRRCEKGRGIPRNGHIGLSNVFPAHKVVLVLFYLHLLASHPTNWQLSSNLWQGPFRLFDLSDSNSFIDE